MPRVATTRWTPPEHTSGTQKGEKEGRQRMRPKGWETSVRVGGARRAWGRVKYCPRRDAGVCAWKRKKRRPRELAVASCLSPPPARSRHLPRHGGRLVVSPQRKGLWRISAKVRVARDAETCDPPWGRTWRAGGKNTEGTEGSRRCTVRPDVARSRREDAERTVGTDGDRRRVLPPDMERVTEGRSSSPVPRSRPSEQAPPRSLGDKNR